MEDLKIAHEGSKEAHDHTEQGHANLLNKAKKSMKPLFRTRIESAFLLSLLSSEASHSTEKGEAIPEETEKKINKSGLLLKKKMSSNPQADLKHIGYNKITISRAKYKDTFLNLAPSILEKKEVISNIQDILSRRDKYQMKHIGSYSKCRELIISKDKSKEPIIDYRRKIEILPKMEDAILKLSQGVYTVHENIEDKFDIIKKDEFFEDLIFILEQMNDSKNKSFARNRLEVLESKFKMHRLYNREFEVIEQRSTPHRDFYNTRKIDTHIHHAACMRAKQLFRFIIDKIENEGDVNVILDEERKPMNLKKYIEDMGINSLEDLNLDALNVQADYSIFQRFDRFNNKYNPLGKQGLREIFLKTDNYIEGKYLAELTSQCMRELEEEKYVFSEWRISIYGKKKDEWSKLAKWFIKYNIFSHQVRWMVQIPRLYVVYKKQGIINNFQDMIDNIFKPLFDVTINPEEDPNLHQMLLQFVGFDTVDDESGFEILSEDQLEKDPLDWNSDENPHYVYWNYYIYANLCSLNKLRLSRGLNTFDFRPHCGESGSLDHLACSFLLSKGINHGIMLEQNSVLQYLFYLKQIGIAMSPLSNNKLFLEYSKNPFPLFFKRGLNVSLSTDDPLIIHLTKEPLLEEYAVAAQVWNLSNVDLSEIARNSVIQCSFEDLLKTHWIGNYKEFENSSEKSNLPYIRFNYRIDTLKEEYTTLKLKFEPEIPKFFW